MGITTGTEAEIQAVIAQMENLDLPSEDGIPLESGWHRYCMNLLIESVLVHMGDRTDYFVGGNMFIYYSLARARNSDFRGPDFFFVDGAPLTPLRESWMVWNEDGRYPDVIIELSSPTTFHIDRTEKFHIYERIFRTLDYFIYDPTTRTLDGWHLVDNRYQPLVANDQGRLWCSGLGLWVGVWHGLHLAYEAPWLRFFDGAGNVVPTAVERERQRADDYRRRADAAGAELARLRDLQGKDPGPPPTAP